MPGCPPTSAAWALVAVGQHTGAMQENSLWWWPEPPGSALHPGPPRPPRGNAEHGARSLRGEPAIRSPSLHPQTQAEPHTPFLHFTTRRKSPRARTWVLSGRRSAACSTGCPESRCWFSGRPALGLGCGRHTRVQKTHFPLSSAAGDSQLSQDPHAAPQCHYLPGWAPGCCEATPIQERGPGGPSRHRAGPRGRRPELSEGDIEVLPGRGHAPTTVSP